MLKQIIIGLVFCAALAPLPTEASPWTEGQYEWWRHGSRHGRWDCYGKCPPEARHYRQQYRHYRYKY